MSYSFYYDFINKIYFYIAFAKFNLKFYIEHSKSDKPYIIKKIPKVDIVKDKQIEHIKNEKKVSMDKNINRDFIVKCYDTFCDDIIPDEETTQTAATNDGHLCFVLEFLPGGDMYSLIKQNMSLKHEDIQFYFAEVILAIKELHSHDIIYRDLKLDNIMIAADGHIKLIDFGFAKYL